MEFASAERKKRFCKLKMRGNIVRAGLIKESSLAIKDFYDVASGQWV